jgi:hypothetical protein
MQLIKFIDKTSVTLREQEKLKKKKINKKSNNVAMKLRQLFA